MQEQVEKWVNEIQYEELINGKNNCPHKLLGLHNVESGQIITAFRPNAVSVKARSRRGKKEYILEQKDNSGFFGVFIEHGSMKSYVLEIRYPDGTVINMSDPYSFEPYITEMDMHLFGEGKHYDIYEKLGAHPITLDGVKGIYFAVWAPDARRVSVVGNFNLWDGRLYPMRILGVSGIYELFIPGLEAGAVYKYQIMTREGDILYKTDPYGNMCELRPNNASQVVDINHYKWNDQAWMKARKQEDRLACRREAMSIYEVHIGSWRKKQDGTEDGFYNYREMAHELADYVVDMGYTHIELMGIAEHPFDGSWGYQVTGYYAPTRRYGTPEDFMYFINYMHSRGINVILDWVPAHFPKDAYGLARFDGAPLYEHSDPRRGEHPHWGTYIFDYGKNEVKNFLLANALFWIEKYHVDGLRVDAVASMLYLDYGKQDGEWLPNEFGGNENLEVIDFLQQMNKVLEERDPGALMIAEESTAWAGVTAPVELDGLGFVFKWNMGWMNDILEYIKLDPYFRKNNHNRLTFGMMYAYSENFVQVFSHDEVVHGKGSMINKMPGEYNDKFANLRTLYGFMYGHPGKKLLFMGQEFAQWREWSEARELDWNLLGEDRNRQMKDFVKRLNHIYQEYSAFYYNDYDPIGFEWMNCSDAERSTLAFVRRGKETKNQLLFIFNFTPVERKDYVVGVPCEGEYTEILNSDAYEYGGSGKVNKKPLKAVQQESNGREYSLSFDLPGLSVLIFKYDYKDSKNKEDKVVKVSKKEKKRQ
ncbi:1,4-alpha-glucan (glycogen) branching enzyme, GH-13-type [Lachnospiraceae bacterium KM106-2]|nr:1,4-alpha-glucan (glycogen) branching enzyme, GH-13-type [Lachnospiraceae bacterium KM106-2]